MEETKWFRFSDNVVSLVSRPMEEGMLDEKELFSQTRKTRFESWPMEEGSGPVIDVR